jgi:hypothetical protein
MPGQAGAELGATFHIHASAQLDWRTPVGGTVMINLFAGSNLDGSVGVGVGRADGVLRFWVD